MKRIHREELRARMRAFTKIYNSAWHVRAAYFAPVEQRAKKVAQFCEILKTEIEQASDKEALLFAVVDALICYPHGLPWEG